MSAPAQPMTVGELIAELGQYRTDLPVSIHAEDGESELFGVSFYYDVDRNEATSLLLTDDPDGDVGEPCPVAYCGLSKDHPHHEGPRDYPAAVRDQLTTCPGPVVGRRSPKPLGVVRLHDGVPTTRKAKRC